jgi:hypothetical protein
MMNRPLKEDEKLPTPTHRVTSSSQIAPPPPPAKASTETTKKPSKKSTEDKGQKEKRKSKKKSHAKADDEHQQPDLLTVEVAATGQGEYNELLSPDTEEIPQPGNTQVKLESASDLDFWLSTARTDEVTVEAAAKKTKKKTKKTDDEETKKEKKREKKEKKPTATVELTQPAALDTAGLNDIEVSNGPKRLFLASTKAIEITYSASPYFMNLNQLLVDVQMKNLSASKEIFQIELNILDTPSLQLIRADTKAGDDLKVPFSLEKLSSKFL